MKNTKRMGIAIMLTLIMVFSIFAALPTASAGPSHTWRDYEYPIAPQAGTALKYKMMTVDLLDNQLPALKYYASLGVFSNDFLVSYMKIKEFMYRSCDPELWWFQDEMYIYTNMYGNYPGDTSKPNPQSAVSQGAKIFQDEYVVIVELNNQIRKLTDDFDAAVGMNALIINAMMSAYKQIRNNLIISDMVMAYNFMDMANSAVDAIENADGKVDLSAVGGPTDFTLEKQSQIIKWAGQASDDFDDGVTGLGLDPSFVKGKIAANQQYTISISTSLDPTAYKNAMKSFEKTLMKAGHALSESGSMEFCMNSFIVMIPAAMGLILCAGAVIEKRKRYQ
jgi:hypothetical protein